MYRHTAVLFLAALVSIADPTASAQEDEYHLWLRSHLSSEYGIEGGAWMFADQEATVLSLASPSGGVVVQQKNVSGQEFKRALSFTVAQAAPNPWDRTVRFQNQTAIASGDALLLAVWLRHLWPVGEEGLVETVFELASEPYTKSLSDAYNVPEEWTLYLVPFSAALSQPAGSARFQLNMGRQKQIIELGGLAILNYGKTYTSNQLPKRIPPQTYAGRSPAASWRTPARQRIEQHRMGNIEVLVTDENGSPLPNAQVRAVMKRHAFGFGTAVATGRMIGSNFNPAYRMALANLTGDGRTFNMAVLENALKWPAWESNWPVSRADKIAVVQWLTDRHFDVRGHNLVWPRWDDLPADIQQNRSNPEYISNRIHDHIMEIGGYPGLKGVLREWDVLNEPAHVTDLREVFKGTEGNPTGEEVYADWFRWAEEADPHARAFINEYGIVSSYGPNPNATARPTYKKLIQGLIDAGVRLDGIGFQGHMGTPLTPIDTVYKVLEEFGAFGRGISITEYDASGVEENLAADYLRDFLTIVFSHPAAESFLMWGFWDGAHWFDDAPIFRQDWSIKPSGQAFLDLVFDAWWTDETGVTDESGVWRARGFLGDYEVTVTSGVQSVSRDATLTATEPVQLTFSVSTTATGNTSPQPSFQVSPNFPEPFTDVTTFSFILSQPEDVRLELFDITGRTLREEALGLKPGGRHTVSLDATSLPSGVFLMRLVAGSHSHTARIMHIR